MAPSPIADHTDRKNEPFGQLANPHTSYGAVTSLPGLKNLIISSICGRTAIRTYQVILVLFVLATYHSASLSGLIVLSSQVPGILISPIAGALLDRRGRVALIATDFFVASLAIGLITALASFHLLPVWALFLIVTSASVTQPLSSTGTRSLYPLVVPRHLWDRANGLDASTFVVATVFGPVLAGLGVAVFGARDALLLPIALYLLGAGILIGVSAPPAPASTTRVLQDALGGLRYVLSNKTLRQLSATVTLYYCGVGALGVAIPILVIDHLHGGATTTGLMLAVLGVGGSFASIATGAIGTVGREHRLMAGSCLIAGLMLALLALCAHDEVLAFVALLVIGATQGPLNITMFSVRQRVTEPAWYGRAFAISMSLNGVGSPIGSAIVGALIGHSFVLAFLLASSVVLISGIWPIVFPFETGEKASSTVRPGGDAASAEGASI